MKRYKKIVMGLGLLGLLFLLKFGLFFFQSQTYKDISEYQAAKQRWSKHTFSNYRLEVHSRYMDCMYDVEVQNEKIVKIYPTDTCPLGAPRNTISELFEKIYKSDIQPDCISECGCEGQTRIEAKYNKDLGYPQSIEIVINEEWNWLYPKYWTDKIGRKFGKYCPPHCSIACNPFSHFVEEQITVKLLKPSP